MEITPNGLSGLNAARHAEEVKRRGRDLAAILHRREMDSPARENQRRLLYATNRNAMVRLSISY